MKTLTPFPETGRPVPHLGPDFCEWPTNICDGTYIVRYSITPNEILPLAIRHRRELDF